MRVDAETTATTRRDAESAASSGMIASHTAMNEAMPPVSSATAVTTPMSEIEERTCAAS